MVSFLLWMGAIANGGRAAEPYLIQKTVSSLGIPSLPHITRHTGRLIDSKTAATVADFMANNVTETYGTKRFPNMELCAKSGTAEVGTGQTPHAWFAGFLRNEDAPYAFVVLVENGGGLLKFEYTHCIFHLSCPFSQPPDLPLIYYCTYCTIELS